MNTVHYPKTICSFIVEMCFFAYILPYISIIISTATAITWNRFQTQTDCISEIWYPKLKPVSANKILHLRCAWSACLWSRRRWLLDFHRNWKSAGADCRWNHQWTARRQCRDLGLWSTADHATSPAPEMTTCRYLSYTCHTIACHTHWNKFCQ